MGGEEALAKLSEEIKEAVHSPRLQTVQILELAERIEALTESIPAWYPATRAGVGAEPRWGRRRS
jgi:hypothetical protein